MIMLVRRKGPSIEFEDESSESWALSLGFPPTIPSHLKLHTSLKHYTASKFTRDADNGECN